MIKTVLFDVDGVLINSLEPHLQFASDLAKKYSIPGKMPTQHEFKLLIKRGVQINPIDKLLSALYNFPENVLKECVIEYEDNFSKNYIQKCFSGTRAAINKLLEEDYRLGIVTSNIIENIKHPLSNEFDEDFFNKFNCVLDKNCFFTKANGIVQAMAALQSLPSETLYVGDIPTDMHAANKAGVHFVGVTYGWSFTDWPQPRMNCVSDISHIIHEIDNWIK